MSTDFNFMAFASGKETTDVEFKRYIGIAPVTVLGVNLNKDSMEKIAGITPKEEPVYLGTTTYKDQNGVEQDVQNLRVSFAIRTVADKCNGIELTSFAPFFIQNRPYVGASTGKTQVIDRYGRTAWAREGVDFEYIDRNAHTIKVLRIPQYSNGPANISEDYRPSYPGEEELTNFIKNLLNIGNVTNYNTKTKTWEEVSNPQECEARLDKIANYFKGDFSELNTIIGLQPNNKVKLMFGVRTDSEGKEYQTVYTNKTFKNGARDFSSLDAEIKELQKNGYLANTEYSVAPLAEYNVTPTAPSAMGAAAQPSGKTWF